MRRSADIASPAAGRPSGPARSRAVRRAPLAHPARMSRIGDRSQHGPRGQGSRAPAGQSRSGSDRGGVPGATTCPSEKRRGTDHGSRAIGIRCADRPPSWVLTATGTTGATRSPARQHAACVADRADQRKHGAMDRKQAEVVQSQIDQVRASKLAAQRSQKNQWCEPPAIGRESPTTRGLTIRSGRARAGWCAHGAGGGSSGSSRKAPAPAAAPAAPTRNSWPGNGRGDRARPRAP